MDLLQSTVWVISRRATLRMRKPVVGKAAAHCRWALCLWFLADLMIVSGIASAAPVPPPTNATVLAVKGTVQVARYRASVWDPAYVQPANQVVNSGDRLRTGKDSWTLLRLSSLTDFPVGELTQLEFPFAQSERAWVRVVRGVLYFFHRDR